MKTKIQLLSELISDSGLKLKVNPENSPISILEDLDYRYAVAALTVDCLGKTNEENVEIDMSILSFGQFIATRPFLISKVKNYVEGTKQKQIGFEEFLGFPRGYIKDFIFKESLFLMISTGVMDFAKTNVKKIEVPTASNMLKLARQLISSGFLLDEQKALIELKNLKLPKYVIEWQ